MTIEFTVVGFVKASPNEVYAAWLDSAGHSAMTGSPATCSSAVGGKFTAWDGYIEGINVELQPGEKIVQRWRTKDFAADHEDSVIEVTLSAQGEGTETGEGTQIALYHHHVPDGQQMYEQGWVTHYFEPMQQYFEQRAAS